MPVSRGVWRLDTARSFEHHGSRVLKLPFFGSAQAVQTALSDHPLDAPLIIDLRTNEGGRLEAMLEAAACSSPKTPRWRWSTKARHSLGSIERPSVLTPDGLVRCAYSRIATRAARPRHSQPLRDTNAARFWSEPPPQVEMVCPAKSPST